MALTPTDIEGKTFGTALRGYDLDEVDDFLDEMVTTLRDLQDQLAEARTAAQEETSAPPVVADESAVGRALIAAQAAADTILSDAKEESEQIVNNARDEAENWATERDAKKAEADAEMAELTDHVSNVRNQLAILATAVADRLDEMDQTINGASEPTATGEFTQEDDTLAVDDEEVETFDLGEADDTDDVGDTDEDGDSPTESLGNDSEAADHGARDDELDEAAGDASDQGLAEDE